jgi:hypothetical protein
MSFLGEVAAGRGGTAVILSVRAPSGGRIDVEAAVLINGGVMYADPDDDGWVRWLPGREVQQIIWKGKGGE